jgi:hypothetical protein
MYHFKQAVCFPGKKSRDEKGHALPDGPSHSYKYGEHADVPKEVEQHPYFLSLVKAGLISESDEPKPAQESVEERAKRLHDKLSEKPQQVPKQEEESKKDKKGKKI